MSARPDHDCHDEYAAVVNDQWVCNCPKGALAEKPDNVVEINESPVMFTAPQKFNVTFTSAEGKEIGSLTENDDGEITFQGDTMESASVFFDAVIALNHNALKSMRTLLSVARCPDENCVDGAIPHQIGDDEWEQLQCQWCHERKLAGDL